MLPSVVDQEVRDLIQKHGRITFAQFMQTALYSRRGGFYSSRAQTINAHFGTAPMSHPAFGALIARQLEQMWHVLGQPRVFHVIEVGCGDGTLAQSVVHACWRTAPEFAQALYYVAADYEPRRPRSSDPIVDWDNEAGAWISDRPEAVSAVRRVKTEGLCAFGNVVGCILSNELIDNFPVHRFAIKDGRVKEVFVQLAADKLIEVLGEPSSPRIEARITNLGLSPHEGYRGEVNL